MGANEHFESVYNAVSCQPRGFKTASEGTAVRQVLEVYFQTNPQVRGYVLNDQGILRKHVAIF